MPRKFAGLLMSAFCSLLISFPASSQNDTTAGVDSEARMKANGCYAHANQLVTAKKFPEAIAKFREAIALWPHSAPYHYNLAMALKQSGNGAEAVTAFQKALEINPKEWRYYKALGNTQWRLRRFADAKSSYENALKYAPPGEIPELKSGINACAAQVTPSNN
jgi:tetratricopeptide (TPR) repeat protein